MIPNANRQHPDLLAPLYTGPLEALTPPRVTSAPPADAIAGSVLLNPARLEALIERFGAQYAHGDRRAVASLWSKWHFNALLAPALAANLLLERDLPLTLGQVHLLLSEQGHTERLCLAHDGTPLASLDAFERFTSLVEEHLAPLVAALARLSGASPRVFWSNAGNVFEHFAGTLEQHPMAAAGTAAPAYCLLESRRLPDGRRNPLHRPVRYFSNEQGEQQRVRRLCCLRYLLPALGYCGNCPLPNNKCK